MAIPFLTNTSFSAAVTVASTLTVGGDALVEDNIYLTDNGTVRGKIQLNSSDRDNLDIKAVSLGSTINFFTVDTLALSLDASQNSTFAGNIFFDSNSKVVKTDLSSGGTTRTAEIEFYASINGAIKYMTTNSSSGGHEFYTQGVQRLEIEKGGNVIITEDLLPASTGASDLGSDAKRFGSLFTNGAFIGTLTNINIQLQGDLKILNKAQSAYIGFATRNTSGSQVVMDITNAGSAAFGGNVTISNSATAQLQLIDTTNNVSLLLGADNSNTFLRNSGGLMLFQTNGGTNALTLSGANGEFDGNLAVAGGTLTLGADVSIFRDGVSILRTDDQLHANNNIYLGGAGKIFDRANNNNYIELADIIIASTDVAITGAATSTTATIGTSSNATLTTKSYVDGLVTGVPVYKGTWDARNVAEGGTTDGGTPDLRLAANKVLGNYYIVSTAGSASPNGGTTEPNSWNVGDWCIFSDVTPGAGTDLWQRIDNSSVVSGAGTGQSVTKWEGTSGAASETLTDGPITFSASDNSSTFAGYIETTKVRSDIMNNKADTANIIYRTGTNTIVGNNADALVIEDGGDVGIGTDSPDAKLHVKSAASTLLRIEGNQNTRFATLELKNASQSWMPRLEGTTQDFVIRDNTAASEPFRIKPTTGNAIFTSDVTTNKAFVSKGQNLSHAISAIKISQESTTKSQIRFYGADTSTPGSLEFVGTSSDASVGGARLTIDSSGNANFSSDVRVNGWIKGGSDKNTLFSTLSTGVLLQTSGNTVANDDSKIRFRNSIGGVSHIFDANNGNATFTGNVTIGDNSASEIFLAFNSSSTDFALGANGSNFMIGTSSDLDSGNLITLSGTNGRLGIGITSPQYKLDVANGGIQAGGVVTYTKSAGGLDTTGYAIAGITAGFNGASVGFEFKCYGGAGKYQQISYSCYCSGTTWIPKKVIDEGTDTYDVAASANGATITFTFKTRSGSQAFSPRVIIQATGNSINSTYA